MNVTSAYRPGREIARGGMGAVLDARDQKLGRSVAMKVMLRRNASKEEQQRFLQEARVLGQLAHPNIVPVHDVGTDEQGRLFYTMKLVQGVTLQDILQKLKEGDANTLARYPLNHLLTVFQKVCDAVAFAHSRGIIHRDLKPHNIMVGKFGEVLVMDWGLAKILPGSRTEVEAEITTGHPPPACLAGAPGGTAAVPEAVTLVAGRDAEATLAATPDEATLVHVAADAATLAPSDSGAAAPTPSTTSTQLTLEGEVMGTSHYMSPEQAEGRIADLDARSDIFSLGGILYALLTLRPPVEGESVKEILSKVQRADITPPSVFNPATRATHLHRPPGDEVLEPKRSAPLPHLPGGRVPGALSAVAMKALALRRESRYCSVGELATDIMAYQGGFATSAENANPLTLLRLFIHRHKALTVAASLMVLLTIGFMAKVLSSERRATRNAERAQEKEREARASSDEAKAEAKRAKEAERATRLALASSVINLAEAAQREGDGPGMQVALHRVPEDLRDSTWSYLLEQSDTSLARVHTSSTDLVSVSPHPRKPGVFAVTDYNRKVTLIEARTGMRLLEFTPGFTNVNQTLRTAVSPDGELIAVAQRGAGGIVIHSAQDGKKLREWSALESERIEFSPDGTLLLQNSNRRSLHIWEVSTGKLLWSHAPERGGGVCQRRRESGGKAAV